MLGNDVKLVMNSGLGFEPATADASFANSTCIIGEYECIELRSLRRSNDDSADPSTDDGISTFHKRFLQKLLIYCQASREIQ